MIWGAFWEMDLKEEIEKFAKERNIQAGCIVSAVGCLNKKRQDIKN